MKRILITALKSIIADDSQMIIDYVNDDSCTNSEDEYWAELWDQVSEDYDSKQDMRDDYIEDCLDDMGDTGYFFKEPTKLSSDTWLIHFTKADPWKIISEGFKGASLEHLGLTRGGGKRKPGDYGLAYDIKDLDEYDLNSPYGKNAILFQSKVAVKAYHRGDDEYQVIFDVRAIKKSSMFGFDRNEQDEYEIYNYKGQNLETRPVELKSFAPSKKKPSDIPF